MEFALPTALAQKIVSYDPILKKEAAARKRAVTTTTRNKPEFPLGKITNLIPHSVVPESDQLQAVELINKSEIAARFRMFYKSEQLAGNVTSHKLIAILYHYESVWYAAWFPEKNGEYFYGFAVAIRNTSKASDKVISIGLNREEFNHVQCEHETHDKKEYRVYRHRVTTQDIAADKCTRAMWNIPGMSSYHKKSKGIWKSCINPFAVRLKESIPCWEDSYDMWERINPAKSNYGAILNDNYPGAYRFESSFVPTAENFLQVFDPDSECDSIKFNHAVYEKFRTPFFRAWLQSQCKEIIDKFNDPSTTAKCQVTAPFRRMLRIRDWIKFVLVVWPDTPVDYFQTHINQMLTMPVPLSSNFRGEFNLQSPIIVWLNRHMKVSSLFKIVDNSCKDFLQKIEDAIQANGGTEEVRKRIEARHINDQLGMITDNQYSNILRDTLNMLDRVLSHIQKNNLPDLDPPKRWRIAEFHDYVQAESWKVQNENIPMPQDLFPQPVKVKYKEQTWTFFQPINTHQLAAWGQAVRNCVGSASSYAEGVKKKQHFIVLGMVDHAPRFTIQLKVNQGVMHVVQITDLCNARLNPNQQADYTEVFGKALEKRAEELALTTNEKEEVSAAS